MAGELDGFLNSSQGGQLSYAYCAALQSLLANMERFTTEGEARILVKVVGSTETVAFHVYPGFLKDDHRKARVHRVNSSAVGEHQSNVPPQTAVCPLPWEAWESL